MKAISLTQPWAWAILHAGKRIENRSRRDGKMPDICRHRGPLLLHAAKGMTRVDYQSAHDFMATLGVTPPPAIQRNHDDGILPRGVIVGRAVAVGHIEPWECSSCGDWLPHMRVHCKECEGTIRDDDGIDYRWWMGGHALILDQVEPVKWVPCRGALGLWTVPDDVVRRLGS